MILIHVLLILSELYGIDVCSEYAKVKWVSTIFGIGCPMHSIGRNSMALTFPVNDKRPNSKHITQREKGDMASDGSEDIPLFIYLEKRGKASVLWRNSRKRNC